MHSLPVRFSVPLAPTTGGTTLVDFHGQAGLAAPGDPASVGAALQQATQAVIQEKLTGFQVGLPTLSLSLAHFIPEIIARASGPLGAQGVGLTSLNLEAIVPPEAIAPAASQVMTGGEIAANVAGNFASNAISHSMPTHLKANIGGFKLKIGPGSSDVGDQVGDQVKNKIQDNIIHYAIVGGVLLLVCGICVVAIAVKLIF